MGQYRNSERSVFAEAIDNENDPLYAQRVIELRKQFPDSTDVQLAAIMIGVRLRDIELRQDTLLEGKSVKEAYAHWATWTSLSE